MQAIQKDEVIIRKAIVHILDCENGFMNLSNTLIDLGEDLNDFLRAHIFRLIDSDDMKKCHFHEDLSLVYSMLQKLDEKDDESFIQTTRALAEQMFDIMSESLEIPSADLICVSYQVQSQVHLALLKMNYKDSYVHFQENDSNDIIKQRIMPSVGARLTEAILINLETMELRLVEKSYEIREEKVNYLSERFLMCYTELAAKKKFSILTRTINDINNKYNGADIKTKLETKSKLQKAFEEEGEFNINEIGQELFGNHVEQKEVFDEKMERYDLMYDRFSVTKDNTVKKLTRQVIVTDTGIEISIPMEEYNSKDNIVITQDVDGTSTITIKNIEAVTIK